MFNLYGHFSDVYRFVKKYQVNLRCWLANNEGLLSPRDLATSDKLYLTSASAVLVSLVSTAG